LGERISCNNSGAIRREKAEVYLAVITFRHCRASPSEGWRRFRSPMPGNPSIFFVANPSKGMDHRIKPGDDSLYTLQSTVVRNFTEPVIGRAFARPVGSQ
jgi:hypothetical protein